ncbi:M20/M25/M40 family metallo-hydrolase [Patulibacter defluvii]|uniref:M20/M25/M40 family metallo-hydrolase n=1 Tax=Patulibacter defluvii TaxID=3095358 RepID=UPI002A749944|nr:M20/M25/M40 family metallo-hydrolase [Patulibacter sp. DM4]
MSAPIRPADPAERQALHDVFAALCAIPSPSGRERACADHAADLLRRLGLTVEEDDAGARIGGDAGNLLCRIPAAAPVLGTEAGEPPTILLCAHLDTVPVAGPIRPLRDEHGWRDEGGGILGADNKATVAALLVLARRLVREPAPVAVELLLTVQEEPQLRGAQAFDAARLRATCGYVVDHPSPLGGIVVGAPGHVRFDARFRGRAAHAGIAPEEGRSAIAAAARAVVALPQGRLPSGATVNVGAIEGGVEEAPDGEPVTNVVPPHARIVGEVRGLDRDTLQATVDALEATLHDAAHDAAGPVDLDLTLQTRFAPYRHRATAEPVLRATAALERLGLTPRPFADGGASDANVLNAAGLATVNLAGGNERAHQPGERISAAALETTLDLLLALVDEHRPGAAPTTADA